MGSSRTAFGRVLGFLVAALVLAPASSAQTPPPELTLPPGFQLDTVFSGLIEPVAVRFAPDGRVFVAEKSGLLYTYDSVLDPTPTLVVDLRVQVHNYWDRGMLGLAVSPGLPRRPVGLRRPTPTTPSRTGPVRAGARRTPALSTSDPCPTPPGPTSDGCVVYGRLSRITVNPVTLVGDRAAPDPGQLVPAVPEPLHR